MTAWGLLRALLALLVMLTTAAPALANPQPDGTPCLAPVLLDAAASIRIDGQVVERSPLFDGHWVFTGSAWPRRDRYVALRRFEATFPAPVRATDVVVQADGDSPFRVEFSTDGESWLGVTFPALAAESGMVSRHVPGPPSSFRFVRLFALEPYARVPTSELQLLCGIGRYEAKDDPLDERDERAAAEVRRVADLQAEGALRVARRPLLRVTLLAGALVLLLLRRRIQRSARLSLARHAVLGMLALMAVSSYLDLPGGGPLPHPHELFHYQLGAEYFSELGYDHLYDCAIVAEVEAGFGSRVAKRRYRDLRTGELRPALDAIGHGGECHARFSPDRWRRFSSDVGYYARALGADGYQRALEDHGFNATPLWLTFGHGLERVLGDPDMGRTLARGALEQRPLVLADVALLLLAVGLVSVAFGWETTGLFAIAVFANPLATPAWTLGGLLRYPWLAALLAGFAALARGRGVLAGLGMGLSAGLRIFPALALVGPLAVAVGRWVRARRPVPGIVQGALGFTAVALVVVAIYPGLPAIAQSAQNLLHHATRDTRNAIGLRSVLAYRPSTSEVALFDAVGSDPFAALLDARAQNVRALWPIRIGLGVLALVALGRVALRRTAEEPDASLRLALAGLATIPIFLTPSSYYYAFLGAFVLTRERLGQVRTTLFGLLTLLAVLALAGPMNDRSFAIASAAVVVWCFWVLWTLGSATRPVERAPRVTAGALLDAWLAQPRAARWVLALTLAIGVSGLLRAASAIWLSDDAHISLRYAQNLLDGNGLVFNPGERVEGYTNLLFTLLVALLGWLSVPLPQAANWISMAAYVAVFALLVQAPVSWRRDRVAFPIAAALWALQQDVVVWATGGLETTLFTLLALGGITSVVSGRDPRRSVLGGALLGLCCATRPDGVIFAAVGLAAPLIVATPGQRRDAVRSVGWILLPLGVVGTALVVFKLVYYGELLPTTYYAKSALRAYYSQGLWYVAIYLAKNWPLIGAVVLAPWTLARSRDVLPDAWRREIIVYALGGGVFAAYVAHSGGDFMHARRIIPAVPFALLAIEGIVEAHCMPGRLAWAGALALGTLFPLALFPAHAPAHLHGIANEPQFYTEPIMAQRRAQGRLARELLSGVPLRASFAGGMCVFAYESRLPDLVEPNGLTNMELARAPLSERGTYVGHEKTASPEALRAIGVQLIFHKGLPPRRPPSYDEIYFDGLLWAELLVYDDTLMSRLARVPGARFQPIEVTLEAAERRMRTVSCADARELFHQLDVFRPGWASAERARMTTLVGSRCTPR